jgi:hypothetical protein
MSGWQACRIKGALPPQLRRPGASKQAGALGIVVPQRPQQNHGHQAGQEDDHHEGVEDAEPVDLRTQQPCVSHQHGIASRDLESRAGIASMSIGKDMLLHHGGDTKQVMIPALRR